jgi:hypothetical protein
MKDWPVVRSLLIQAIITDKKHGYTFMLQTSFYTAVLHQRLASEVIHLGIMTRITTQSETRSI